MLFSEVVRDFAVAHSLGVQLKYFPHNGGAFLVNGYREVLVSLYPVAVGNGAEPLSVFLAVGYYALYLFACVRYRHLVHKKAELYRHPVVECRVVYSVADRDYANSLIAEIFKLHQPLAVPARETAEILDYQDIVFAAHQLPAHFLVAGTLVERVAGTVAVLVKRQFCFRELHADVFFDYGFLVFYRGVVAVYFHIYGDSAVACYI